MARRTLLNLDERLLSWVISEGAKKGMGGISTAHIAAQLRISEPLIFIHFQNKDNLLKEAYRSALIGLYGSLSLPTAPENPCKNLVDGLLAYGNAALANPEKARYVLLYEIQSVPTPNSELFSQEAQSILALFKAVKPFEKTEPALLALRRLLSAYADALIQKEIPLEEASAEKIVQVFIALAS